MNTTKSVVQGSVIRKQPVDVLSGGAGGASRYQDHPGNLFFRQLVSAKARDYLDGTAERRDEIVEEVRAAVTSRGGRFLTLTFNQERQLWLWQQVAGDFLVFVIHKSHEDAATTGGDDKAWKADPLDMLKMQARNGNSELIHIVKKERSHPIRVERTADEVDQDNYRNNIFPLVTTDHSPRDVQMARSVKELTGDSLVESLIRDFDHHMRTVD